MVEMYVCLELIPLVYLIYKELCTGNFSLQQPPPPPNIYLHNNYM